jgi:hypothetical protein
MEREIRPSTHTPPSASQGRVIAKHQRAEMPAPLWLLGRPAGQTPYDTSTLNYVNCDTPG